MQLPSIPHPLKEKAEELGFSLVGWVSAQPARRLDAYLAWVEAGMHGKMGYLARPDRLERRQDLNVILPGVETILCVGLDYKTAQLPARITGDPARGRISSYAWGADYHDIMIPRLESLAAWVKKKVNLNAGEIKHRVYVDTGAILERDHAESAGFGFTGKNTMLIHPRRGSWFFLGEILITLPIRQLEKAFPVSVSIPIPIKENEALLKQRPSPMPSCGRCTSCLTACPTNAFPQPYVLDARRCISYLTIELKESIPHELRPLIGNWIYGCDVCQEVCPFNRFAQLSPEPSFGAKSLARQAPALLDLLSLDQERFKLDYATSPIKRIKWARFMRNVAVAAGNWGNQAAVQPLFALLEAESPLVREHAAWALGKISNQHGDRAIKTNLAERLTYEEEEKVRLEIDLALND